MVHRFRFSGLPCPAAPPAAALAEPRPDPISALLRDLRGREVALQLGGTRLVGRLVTLDPVIIVGPTGRATLVRSEAIMAVEF